MPSLSGAFNNQKHCTHRQAPTPIPVVPLRCLGLWTARMETEPTVTLTLSAACTSHLSGASKIFFLLSPSSHLQIFYFKGSSYIKSMLIIYIYYGNIRRCILHAYKDTRLRPKVSLRVLSCPSSYQTFKVPRDTQHNNLQNRICMQSRHLFITMPHSTSIQSAYLSNSS